MKPKRYRIVYILTDGQYGGAQRSVQWLAAVLDRRKFDYHFIFLYSGGPIQDAIASMGYPVNTLNWQNGYTLFGRLKLIRLLRRIEPDIIHAHDATPLSRLFTRLTVKCPIISTQHGEFAYKRAGRLRLFFSWLDDRVTDIVIANSDFSARSHGRLYHRPPSKIRTIYLGLDLEKFALKDRFPSHYQRTKENHDLRKNDLKIIFVGRLELVKGVLQLPLLAQALQKRKLERFKILIVGDGKAHAALVQSAEQLGVSQYFDYRGWQADVFPALCEADIFVFPSLWDEPFGLAALEALAAGLPVVAYDVGGVREALEGGPGAYLVPRGDIATMADTVLRAISSSDRHDQEAREEYIHSRFDIRRTACQIELMYSEILKLDEISNNR